MKTLRLLPILFLCATAWPQAFGPIFGPNIPTSATSFVLTNILNGTNAAGILENLSAPRYVTTLSDLATCDTDGPSRVVTLGYSTPGDGGGTAWSFNAVLPSDLTTNAYTVIRVSGGYWIADDARGPISIARFGAKGDGTDISTSINAAQASLQPGTSVLFPSGTWTQTNQVTLTNNLVLSGVGDPTVVFDVTGVGNIHGWLVSGTNIVIRSLTFDAVGSATRTNAYSIICYGGGKAVVQDCTFKRIQNRGVVTTSGSRVTVQDCVFYGPTYGDSSAFVNAASGQCTVVNCRFYDGYSALNAAGTHHDIYASADYGPQLIRGNYHLNSDNPVKAEATSVMIQDNYVDGTGMLTRPVGWGGVPKAVFQCKGDDGAGQVIITGNMVTNSFYTSFVWISNTDQPNRQRAALIANNRFQTTGTNWLGADAGNTHYGLWIGDAELSTVTGNVLINSKATASGYAVNLVADYNTADYANQSFVDGNTFVGWVYGIGGSGAYPTKLKVQIGQNSYPSTTAAVAMGTTEWSESFREYLGSPTLVGNRKELWAGNRKVIWDDRPPTNAVDVANQGSVWFHTGDGRAWTLASGSATYQWHQFARFFGSTNPTVNVADGMSWTSNNVFVTRGNGVWNSHFPDNVLNQAITAATDQIAVTDSYKSYFLNPDADYTLSSSPEVADGVVGQTVRLFVAGNEANSITFNDQDSVANSGLQLGAATRVLGANDVLVLMYNGTDWCEVSYANN